MVDEDSGLDLETELYNMNAEFESLLAGITGPGSDDDDDEGVAEKGDVEGDASSTWENSGDEGAALDGDDGALDGEVEDCVATTERLASAMGNVHVQSTTEGGSERGAPRSPIIQTPRWMGEIKGVSGVPAAASTLLQQGSALSRGSSGDDVAAEPEAETEADGTKVDAVYSDVDDDDDKSGLSDGEEDEEEEDDRPTGPLGPPSPMGARARAPMVATETCRDPEVATLRHNPGGASVARDIPEPSRRASKTVTFHESRPKGGQDDDHEDEEQQQEEEMVEEESAEWGSWGSMLSKASAVAVAALDVAARRTSVALDLAEGFVMDVLEPIAFDGTGDDRSQEVKDYNYEALLRAPKAAEIKVGARSTVQLPFLVRAHESCMWRVRLKHLDVKFGVKLRRQAHGGSFEDDIVPLNIVHSTEAVCGGHLGLVISEGDEQDDRPRQIVLTFDNLSSRITDKQLCYQVLVGSELRPEDLETIMLAQDTVDVSFVDAEPAVAKSRSKKVAADTAQAAADAELLARWGAQREMDVTLTAFPRLWMQLQQTCCVTCAVIPGVEIDPGFPHISFPQYLSESGISCLGSLASDFMESQTEVSASLKCVVRLSGGSNVPAAAAAAWGSGAIKSSSFDVVDLEVEGEGAVLKEEEVAVEEEEEDSDAPYPVLLEIRVLRLGPSPVYAGYHEWRLSLAMRSSGRLSRSRVLELCGRLNLGAQFYLVGSLSTDDGDGVLKHEPDVCKALGW
jgi:hypothetical protein